MPGVRAPLPDIPVHIVQSKAVRWKAAGVGRSVAVNSRRFLREAVALADKVGQVGGDGRAAGEGCDGSCPAGVFPLRFAGQADGQPGFPRQPFAEFGRVLPADLFDGPLGSPEAHRRQFPHHRQPLGLRDQAAPQVKGRNMCQVERAFIFVTARAGRAHLVEPAREGSHLERDPSQVDFVDLD